MKKILHLGAVALIFIGVTALPGEAGPWPDGLKEAARDYIALQQAEQYEIRDSTLGELKGIIPMSSFDRESHNCHEVSGQAYRVYGKPRFAGKAEGGGYYVRVVFEVFYRQADRVRDLMDQAWQEGSDSGIKITFQQIDGKWVATAEKELLTMDR